MREDGPERDRGAIRRRVRCGRNGRMGGCESYDGDSMQHQFRHQPPLGRGAGNRFPGFIVTVLFPGKIKQRAILAAMLLAALGAARPAVAARIDMALVLAVYVSESVDAGEYRLQHEGIARACENPDVIAAI